MHLKRPDPEMLEELLRSQPRPPARINLGIYAPRGAGGGYGGGGGGGGGRGGYADRGGGRDGRDDYRRGDYDRRGGGGGGGGYDRDRR